MGYRGVYIFCSILRARTDNSATFNPPMALTLHEIYLSNLVANPRPQELSWLEKMIVIALRAVSKQPGILQT